MLMYSLDICGFEIYKSLFCSTFTCRCYSRIVQTLLYLVWSLSIYWRSLIQSVNCKWTALAKLIWSSSRIHLGTEPTVWRHSNDKDTFFFFSSEARYRTLQSNISIWALSQLLLGNLYRGIHDINVRFDDISTVLLSNFDNFFFFFWCSGLHRDVTRLRPIALRVLYICSF